MDNRSNLELIHAERPDFGRVVFIRYETDRFGVLGESW